MVFFEDPKTQWSFLQDNLQTTMSLVLHVLFYLVKYFQRRKFLKLYYSQDISRCQVIALAHVTFIQVSQKFTSFCLSLENVPWSSSILHVQIQCELCTVVWNQLRADVERFIIPLETTKQCPVINQKTKSKDRKVLCQQLTSNLIAQFKFYMLNLNMDIKLKNNFAINNLNTIIGIQTLTMHP